jgi:fucose permease
VQPQRIDLAGEPATPVLGAALLAKALAGLLISGLLTGMPGAIVLVWRHHIECNYLLIGLYFFVQAAGVLASPWWGTRLLQTRGLRATFLIASSFAVVSLLLLLLGGPPAHVAWRLAGLFLAGSSAGLMNLAVFRAASPAYESQPAATLNLAGVFFGAGCLISALVVGGSFFVYEVPATAVLLLVLPALACVTYGRSPIPSIPTRAQPRWGEVWRDLRSPAAVLLALFLFFEFGNEGAIAGWLALFLTQKLGISPARAISLLGLYWAALLGGRIAVQALLPRIRHSRILLGSVAASMFGCTILAFTDNLFGAVTGILMCGMAFAATLPLVAERIGNRFPYFHPGFFNGIFSLALTGGLLAPASIGLYASYLGIGVVMAVPLCGSVMVLLLLLLIFLEARFRRRSEAASA